MMPASKRRLAAVPTLRTVDNPAPVAGALAALRGAVGGREVHHDALLDLGFADPATALMVMQLLTVAQHHDAADVPNVDIAQQYRLAAGSLARRILHPSDPTDKDTTNP